MASFVQEIWESIFVPGTTPTLLVATNVTFASLQLVLFLLLVATYSIHFIILSFLCGGLWWAINWFAAELQVAQAKEAREKARAEQRPAAQTSGDSETEVETIATQETPAPVGKGLEAVEQAGDLKLRPVPSTGTKSSASTEDEWEKVSENENEKDK
ncbi:Pkr1-domain-containing protein [Durotheca rogersii]|uniref:Pkr1-domain-containing protein n=1 Tax=Durotheca rogersii TaxID=419775 RepID=UPI00221FBE35|nr:Pkr1-domain-containing protein [Durotheca rogersii]KAI5862126.1 Pkr1-domain-containing protein [Durotheca rogersii]